MKINLIPFAFAFLCLVGASASLSLMNKYAYSMELEYYFESIATNFKIVTGFFALCACLFLSVSFTKKS